MLSFYIITTLIDCIHGMVHTKLYIHTVVIACIPHIAGIIIIVFYDQGVPPQMHLFTHPYII